VNKDAVSALHGLTSHT